LAKCQESTTVVLEMVAVTGDKKARAAVAATAGPQELRKHHSERWRFTGAPFSTRRR
jgi:hypothetical protein